MPLLKGFKHSEETRAKMRAKALGSNNSMFGRTTSELQKLIASQTHKGSKHSLEQIEKWRQSRAGWKPSEESKEKNRIAHLGNKNHLGHKHTEESKEKNRLAHLGANNVRLGVHHTDEAKAKIRATRMKTKFQSTSKVEREFIWALTEKFNQSTILVGYNKLPVPTIPDIYIPTVNLAIFIDGCYWHACPLHGNHLPNAAAKRTKDLQFELDLINHEINVIRIWEHDLKGNIPFYVNQIKNLIYWYSIMNVRAA